MKENGESHFMYKQCSLHLGLFAKVQVTYLPFKDW